MSLEDRLAQQVRRRAEEEGLGVIAFIARTLDDALKRMAPRLVRIVTNQRIFKCPSTLDEVFAFTAELVRRPTARVVAPGPDHLSIFEQL